MKAESDAEEIQREVEIMVEIRTKEAQKEDDSPIHFHIWDLMFLRSWVNGTPMGRLFSMESSWKDPRGFITIEPCLEARDRIYSDTQLVSSIQLPRWHWALFKIRAVTAALL
jgi:hypothetical protein